MTAPVTVANYDALADKKNQLIRKALDGSAFLAKRSADPIEAITGTAGALLQLPAGYGDLGYLTGDGMSFGRDVTTSDITSFGSTTPTRSDITNDTTTVTINCQETKLLTLGMATGIDVAATSRSATTGELILRKPPRPTSKYWQILALAVDLSEFGEIYIARFFPNAKPTSFPEQAFADGDNAITWGTTFTAYVDNELGYSESWHFGGPGWIGLLTDMGFTALAP